jgi:single-strand DNA-binding protein
MRDINSLNKVILIGRLGGKPEMRYLPQKERQVARFTMATNERFFNTSTRESTDRTEWHRIVVWGKLAEFCEKYLGPGKQILLEGKLRTRSWQDKEGNKRTTTEIEAMSIVLLGRRDEASVAADIPETETRSSTPAAAAEEEFPNPEEGGSGEDDVPF